MPTTELGSADLQDILQFTVSLARNAGKLILEGSEAIQSASANNVSEKINSVDLVTEYDVRVEELVKQEIKNKYPQFELCVTPRCEPSVCFRLMKGWQHRRGIVLGRVSTTSQ
jgi:3'-phosphoadenosine 5'-phosphosulfate (PAPS) 3'-phosphatase